MALFQPLAATRACGLVVERDVLSKPYIPVKPAAGALGFVAKRPLV